MDKQVLINIIEKIRIENNLEPIKISFKNGQRGHSYYNTRHLIFPNWIFKRLEEFQIYYAIHELSHFLCNDKRLGFGHGREFKTIEQGLLKEYNINIIYSKAYPKYLYDNLGFFICGKEGLDTQEDFIKFQRLGLDKR